LLPDATVIRHILASAGITAEIEETTLGVVARVGLEFAVETLCALRESELDFRMLLDLFGTDTGDDVEVTYHLRSLSRDEEVYVKTSLPYDGALRSMLLDLFGTDTGDDVEVTYHLRSLSRDEEVYVKTSLPYDGALRSVWNTYPSALAPERETAELLGLQLDGHPNPKRLLTTDGVEPLLRKSVPIRTVEEVRAR